MRRLLLALALAFVGCGDDVVCPWVQFVDGFQLVVDSESWDAAQYQIEVTYTDRYGETGFACNVVVPPFVQDGALDGGFALAADAGIDSSGGFRCTPLAATARGASGQVGQAIRLTFEGTPASAHVVIKDGSTTLHDSEVSIAYEAAYPYGRQCGLLNRGAALIEL
ncbi:MAG TPA: hypothetical protein VI299_17690 [Polyangiales bacterium]